MKQLYSVNPKKLLLACAVGLFSAGLSVELRAQSFQVSDIRVEGLQRVSASPAFAALPIEAGDFVDSESIKIAIRSLFATGFFQDIEVYADNGVLIFKVKELPTISEITIDGNKAIKTEMLESALSDNGLDVGQIFQQSTLDAILNELEKQYISQGRYSAEVKAEITELPHSQIKIDVVVDEGKVASIKHINIVGNKVFSDEELLGLFELNSTAWNSWLTSNDRYAREKLKGDLESLESYYLDRGYLDFKVLSSQVSLSPDQKSVFITLSINEGDIYTVNKVELAGDLILSEQRIRRMLMVREGQTFSQALLTGTTEFITARLGDAGYTNAEVEGIPKPNPEDNTVDVTFLINPSQRVYVRRIEFRGNTRTQDEVLRREMRQMEGAPASNARIEQGKVRLERLGFFKEVNAENRDVPGAPDQIDVEYAVEEQPSAAINASIGYGQTTGTILSASLTHNNWQGSGKQVGASVSYNKYQTLFNLSYTDPYFTPDGVNRGIRLFYDAKHYGQINLVPYSTDSFGVSFNFGYPISEIQGLNFSFGFNNLKVDASRSVVQEIRSTPVPYDLDGRYYPYVSMDDIDLFDPGGTNGVYEDFSFPVGVINEDMFADIKPGFVDLYGDDFNSLTWSTSWNRRTLNRGIMATRGSQQTVSFDFTIPGSDLQYYTFRYRGVAYKGLNKDFSLKFRTNLGYGDGYGDMERLPFFRNFNAGGFGSVRGFRRSSLGPKASPSAYYTTLQDTYGYATDYTAVDTNGDGINDDYDMGYGGANVLCNQDIDQYNFLKRRNEACKDGELMRAFYPVSYNSQNFGGNVLIELGTELIFPIPFAKDQRSMQSALFIDAGNVFDTNCGDTQLNCSSVDMRELRASYGIGLNWLSAMGPLTFSYSRPISYKEGDEREGFQFSLAAPF